MAEIRTRSKVEVVAALGVALGLMGMGLRSFSLTNQWLILAAALSPLVALAASLVAAGLLRKHGGKVLALPLVVGLIAANVGGVSPRHIRCAAPDDSDVQLYSHNVLHRVSDVASEVEQIRQADPDVVLLQESDARFVDELQDELGDSYPHHVQGSGRKTAGLAILSRYPLVNVEEVRESRVTNRMLMATIDLDPGSDLVGEIRVANVHLTAPVDSYWASRWQTELADLADLDVDVIIGDFNSSSAHKQFRQVLDAGYRDAHQLAGCGSGSTWSPVGVGPGVLQLDHTLVAESVSVRSHQKLDRAGSDHMAIMSAIAVTSSGVEGA